jgi:hypothetical protein
VNVAFHRRVASRVKDLATDNFRDRRWRLLSQVISLWKVSFDVIVVNYCEKTRRELREKMWSQTKKMWSQTATGWKIYGFFLGAYARDERPRANAKRLKRLEIHAKDYFLQPMMASLVS